VATEISWRYLPEAAWLAIQLRALPLDSVCVQRLELQRPQISKQWHKHWTRLCIDNTLILHTGTMLMQLRRLTSTEEGRADCPGRQMHLAVRQLE